MENNEWKGLLQENFDSFEPEPSRDLWPEILNAIQPEKKKGIWLMYRPYLVAAAAAILLVIAFGFLFNGNDAQESPSMATDEKIEKQVHPAPEKLQEMTPETPQSPTLAERVTPVNNDTEKLTVSPSLPKPASPQQKEVEKIEKVFPEEIVREEKETLAISPVKKPKKTLDLPAPAIMGTQRGVKLVEDNLAVVISPAPLTIERPASPVVTGERHDIDLNDLNVRSVAAFASDRMERLGVTTPVEVIEKEFSNSTSKTVKVGFNLFNVTHTRHKKFTIKKPGA